MLLLMCTVTTSFQIHEAGELVRTGVSHCRGLLLVRVASRTTCDLGQDDLRQTVYAMAVEGHSGSRALAQH